MEQIQGIEPTLRIIDPSTNSVLLCIILGCLVVNAFTFPTLLGQWQSFFKQLIRPHSNLMQAERTFNERTALAMSLVQTIIMEGIALYCITAHSDTSEPVASFCGMTLLAAILFATQLVAYHLIGYAFATDAASQSWILSFLKSQSLTGYLLIIPSLGALFYPSAASGFIISGLTCFCLCRILFYIRSFAFFYTSAASLFYFFLYLCTVEIVPLSVVWTVKDFFFSIFR